MYIFIFDEGVFVSKKIKKKKGSDEERGPSKLRKGKNFQRVFEMLKGLLKDASDSEDEGIAERSKVKVKNQKGKVKKVKKDVSETDSEDECIVERSKVIVKNPKGKVKKEVSETDFEDEYIAERKK